MREHAQLEDSLLRCVIVTDHHLAALLVATLFSSESSPAVSVSQGDGDSRPLDLETPKYVQAADRADYPDSVIWDPKRPRRRG